MFGSESILIAALTTIASDIAKDGKQGIFYLFRENISRSTKQMLFDASKRYILSYGERHAIVRVLDMRKPITLESVYTETQILEDPDYGRYKSISSLEDDYRKERLYESSTSIEDTYKIGQGLRLQSRNRKARSGIQIANEEKFLMIRGGPGSGKSTFLRKIGMEALKGNQGELKYQCIPVFIELKRFAFKSIDIEKFLIKEFETCGFPNPANFTRQALQKGRLLVLLDGLDEVPEENKSDLVRSINDFVDLYDRNRFIASCRSADRSTLQRFTDVEIAYFEDEQIHKFIHNWFQEDQPDVEHKCWKTLNKPDNSAAKELARTPLLLTFLCLVYDRSQSFPLQRSIIYRKALRILLEEWNASKRIVQDEMYQGLTTELEEMLLCSIAYKKFVEGRLFFDRKEIVEEIKEFLHQNLNAPKALDGENIIKVISIQQGILVERAENVFSFSHLTLQEYLTALYVESNNEIQALVEKYILDERWREIFLLTAELMRGGTDELILLMNKKARTYIESTSKIQEILFWANEKISCMNTHVSSAARKAAIIYVARLFDRSTFLDRALALDLALELDKGNYDLALFFSTARALGRSIDQLSVFERAMEQPFNKAYPERIKSFKEELNSTKLEILEASIDLARKGSTFGLFSEVDLKEFEMSLSEIKKDLLRTYSIEENSEVFREELKISWAEFIGIKVHNMFLSESETFLFRDYLYAIHLMVKCKQAATMIKLTTWKEIEDRILLN